MELSKDEYTISELAEAIGKTRGAIAFAIMRKALVAGKREGRWRIKKEDYQDYVANKYNTDKRTINGERVFDGSCGKYSIRRAKDYVNTAIKENDPADKHPITIQNIYYQIRAGRLKTYKIGYDYVIKKEDLDVFIPKYIAYRKEFYSYKKAI
jgi:hypothetical protein